MKVSGRLLLSLGLMLTFLVLIIIALGYNPLARLLPLVVAIPIFILSVVQFLLDLREALGEGRAKTAKGAKEPSATEQFPEGQSKEKGKRKLTPQEARRGELLAVGWIFGFFALIILVGFQIAIALFVFLFTRLYGREGWQTCIGLAAVCWIIVYVVFVVMLKSNLYPGVVFEALS